MADDISLKLGVQDQLFLAQLNRASGAVSKFVDNLEAKTQKAQYASAGLLGNGGGGLWSQFTGSALTAGLAGMSMVTGAATAVAGAFTGVIKGLSIIKPYMISYSKAAMEQEEAETQLRAALNATGKQLQLNVRDLANYAGEMERTTKFSDEQVIASFKWFAQLRRLPAEQVKYAMKLSLDMAEVAGEQTPEAAVRRLARALEDPRRATRSLRSAGIMINTQERDLLESLDKHGRYAEAMNVILAAVERAVGGAAELQAKTLAGQLHQIQGMTEDLKKFAGYYINEFLKPIAAGLREGLIEWTSYFDGIVDKAKWAQDQLQLIAVWAARNFDLGQGTLMSNLTPEQRAQVDKLVEPSRLQVGGRMVGGWASAAMRMTLDTYDKAVNNTWDNPVLRIWGAPISAAWDKLTGTGNFREIAKQENLRKLEQEGRLEKQRLQMQQVRDQELLEANEQARVDKINDDNAEAAKRYETEVAEYKKRKANEYFEHLGRMQQKYYKETRTLEETAQDQLMQLRTLWKEGYLMGPGGADLYNRGVQWIRQEYLEGGDYTKNSKDLWEKVLKDRKDLKEMDDRIIEKSAFKSSVESLSGLWNKIQVGAMSDPEKDPVAQLKKQRVELAEQAATRERQLQQLIDLQRNREIYAASFR